MVVFRREFNIDPGILGLFIEKTTVVMMLVDMNHFAPMVKLLWQLPTTSNLVLEIKICIQ